MSWETVEGKKLRRAFKFQNFKTALAFVVEVGKMSDEIDHHPEITLSWGKVVVELWTHDVGGISGRDHKHAELTDAIAERHDAQ